MKGIKRLLLVMLTFSIMSISAENTREENESMGDWQKYKSGPAVSIYSKGGVSAGYYFLKNNSMSFDVFISPLTWVKNNLGVKGDNGNMTTLGFELFNYAPLNRQLFDNRLFLTTGVGYFMPYGVSVGNFKPIEFAWTICLMNGLQWRFNDKFYLGLNIVAFEYFHAKFKNNPTIKQLITVYATGWVYLTYKF